MLKSLFILKLYWIITQHEELRIIIYLNLEAYLKILQACYSTGAVAASFTSTSMDRVTEIEPGKNSNHQIVGGYF